MSVCIKIKDFELHQTINEVILVAEFESEEGGKVFKYHCVE